MANDKIIIKGAREHNLKNINLTLPREKLIVMTGLSGSGKSSLAFDTIYADGQRRYVESLSSYARMFLGRMDKPDVDEITGLSPAISIDQKTTSHNPRSTVGTVTEIYDYLRLLYARIGVPHCPVCGRVISQQTVDEMVDAVLKLEEGTKFQILAPVVRQRKGTQQKELDAARRAGYARVKIDGNLYDLDEEISLEKNIKHTVEIVVDRLALRKGIRSRLADSLETALALTGGVAEVDVIGGECMTFSQNFACPEHGISISDLSPRLFSFNNPLGACEKCTGLGTFMRVDEDRILPNRSLSIREGAIKASGWYYAEGSVSEMYYLGLGKKYGFTLDTPIKEMSTEAVNALLYGTNGEKIEMHRTNEFGSGVYYNTFEGIVENLERRFRETSSEWMKEEIGSFMSGVECPDCHGQRLKPVVLAVTIGDKNISQFCEMSIRDELEFIRQNEPNLTEKQQQIGGQIMKEIKNRLQFLQSVGLDYLTLARAAGTLSGGESQRIRLTTQIGSALSGVLYVLDEPSIGLHPSNIEGLRGVMHDLIADGNSIVLVDHDTEILRDADWLIEMGPGAGENGGTILTQGTVEQVTQSPASRIGPFLADLHTLSARTRTPEAELFALGTITLRTRAIHTVKPLEVRLPKGRLIAVTGVSGSGKSMSAKEEIVQIALSTEDDILILDPESEFGYLTEALGGEVIRISATSDTHINALDMDRAYGDERNPIVSKSEFVLSLFEQLIGDGMVTAKEKSILGRCTEQVYLPYIRNGYKGTPPTLQDFYRLLQMQPEPEAQGLALSSELFITGTLNTFARHTNVDTQARIIAYDIRELGEQLMPLGMLVTLDAIYNRVIQNWKKGRRTWIFCDEFYILFRYEYSANFFYKLWKRIRKYNGLVTGLTQNVDELLRSDTARLMLANSEFLVMLNQSATDRAELAKLLNISDNQLGYVTNVPAGCGLIRCAGNIVPFTNSFPRNTKLYKLMSTNPSEKKE